MPKGRRWISSKFAGRLNPRRSVRGWQISGRLPRRSAARTCCAPGAALLRGPLRSARCRGPTPRRNRIAGRSRPAPGRRRAASDLQASRPYLTIEFAPGSAAGWVPRNGAGTVRSRRPRRRADQPKPEPVGLFEQFGGWRPRQPNRVEAKLFQQPAAVRRGARMTRGNIGRPSTSRMEPANFTACFAAAGRAAAPGSTPGKRMIASPPRSGRLFEPVAKRPGAGGAGGRRLQRHRAGHVQVVDPDVCDAPPAIDVQQHGVEIGLVAVRPAGPVRRARPGFANSRAAEFPPAAIVANGRRRCNRCPRERSSAAGPCGDRSSAARRFGPPAKVRADRT